jgi:transcriptional regulator with XRE-family HTH domain
MKAKPSARRIFADNLRKARLARELSQEDLAELASLHRTYVGSVERAERNVSIDNMERLAVSVGVSLPSLLQEGKR